MKILLSTPCAGSMVHAEYAMSLLARTINAPERLLNLQRYDIAPYLTHGQSGLSKDRNIVASFALRNGFDKLFCIDADQTWTWEQFKTIVDSEQKIIAGVVALKAFPIQLNFTPTLDDKDVFAEDNRAVTPAGLDRLIKKHGKDEIPVQCMGTAFMCIDVSVLAKLAESPHCPKFVHEENGKQVWVYDFFQTGVVEPLYYGEDWGFCLQAARAGFQPHINAKIHIPHIGQHTYKIGQELINHGEIK